MATSFTRRFVIHKHTRGGQVHWDLMVEWGNVLKTWRLDKLPARSSTETIEAISIFDHDKKFLAYQGPVNNGKGIVEIVDEGSCVIEQANSSMMKITLISSKNPSQQFVLLKQNNHWLLQVV